MLKLTEGPRVGTTLCPYDNVPGSCEREQTHPDEFPEPTLEPVAINSGMSVSWHYEPHAQVCQRGSTHPNQETVRSESLPLASDSFEVRPATDSRRARKPMVARRPRTSTAV